MFKLNERNLCYTLLCMISLSNGLCVVVFSSLMFKQTLHLLQEQRLQREDFAHVHKAPFKNGNWMKSALPLVISTALGILIGVVQTTASVVSLIMDTSKSIHLRRMGWLMWMSAGMLNFTLSSLSFALAVILKAHEYRDPNDSASFWTNYQFKRDQLEHDFQGHAFCSALAWNCAFLLTSIAIVAGQLFRRPDNPRPHYLLGM